MSTALSLCPLELQRQCCDIAREELAALARAGMAFNGDAEIMIGGALANAAARAVLEIDEPVGTEIAAVPVTLTPGMKRLRRMPDETLDELWARMIARRPKAWAVRFVDRMEATYRRARELMEFMQRLVGDPADQGTLLFITTRDDVVSAGLQERLMNLEQALGMKTGSVAEMLRRTALEADRPASRREIN